MNLKKIIREELERGNPLDWMMGGPKFDPNEILQKNKEKKVVALWIGDMDEYLSDFFNDFVKKNGYKYVDFVPENLSKGNVKGLTFYPNGYVGFFRGRESWDTYLNGVYGYEYVDIDPSNIYVMDLSDMNLQEQIYRIQEMMNLNELGGDSSSFDDRRINRYRESDPYKDKKYNPESTQDFSNSKVNKVVWRAGGLENFKDGGGLWFAENKEDVEKFALSVRKEKREGKPYYINLENPYYYRSFWNGYISDVGYSKYGREKLMYELISDGHDGIIIGRDNWNDTGDENSVTSEQYVVFNPENVKPA
jgi:hypothetical protein